MSQTWLYNKNSQNMRRLRSTSKKNENLKTSSISKHNTTTLYLVRWEGFGTKHKSWVPRNNLKNYSQLINKYNYRPPNTASRHQSTRRKSEFIAFSNVVFWCFSWTECRATKRELGFQRQESVELITFWQPVIGLLVHVIFKHFQEHIWSVEASIQCMFLFVQSDYIDNRTLVPLNPQTSPNLQTPHIPISPGPS